MPDRASDGPRPPRVQANPRLFARGEAELNRRGSAAAAPPPAVQRIERARSARPWHVSPWVLATSALLACTQPQRSDDAALQPGPVAAGDAQDSGPTLRRAGPGDASELVQDARQESLARGRALLVYVGTSWCEPCTRFKEALAAGELDDRLPGLDLLEFDADEDRERLETAGYGSRLIPLFCVPDARGRASSRRVEGSVKGPNAVEALVPRVAALLEGSPG